MKGHRSIFLWIPSSVPLQDLVGAQWRAVYSDAYVMESHMPGIESQGTTVWYRLKRQTNYWVPDVPDESLRNEFLEWKKRKIHQTLTLKHLASQGKVTVKEWDDLLRPPPGTADLKTPGGRLTGYRFGKTYMACVLYEAAPSAETSSEPSLSYDSWGNHVPSDQLGPYYSAYPSSQYAGNTDPLTGGSLNVAHQLSLQQAHVFPPPLYMGGPSLSAQTEFAGVSGVQSEGSMMNSPGWTDMYGPYYTQNPHANSNVLGWGPMSSPYYAPRLNDDGQSAFTMPRASIGTGPPIEQELSYGDVTSSVEQVPSQTASDSGTIHSGTNREHTPPIVRSPPFSTQRF